MSPRSRCRTPSSRWRGAEASRDRYDQDRALGRDRHPPQGRARSGEDQPRTRRHRGDRLRRAVHLHAADHRPHRHELREKPRMDHSASRTHYAVPQPMPWPIMGSTSLFLMALGAVFVFNGHMGGWVSIAAGLTLLIYMMVRWFGDVIRESEGGKYGRWEDVSFRWGMSWFIFSEVMFFGAFFGALWRSEERRVGNERS